MEIVGNEDTPNIQLDVLLLLSVLVEVLTGLGVGDEKKRLEGDFSLSNEVNMSDGSVFILSDRLVELIIVLLGDLFRFPRPDRFRFITRKLR